MTSHAEARLRAIRLYQPPSECGDGRCHGDMDAFWQFTFCVLVPAGCVLLLVMVLARCMCCSSCRCKKKSSEGDNNGIDMDTYNSIRRASATVRRMSHSRETALLGNRSGTMTLDRQRRRPHGNRDSCNSAPGTLQRQNRNKHDRNGKQDPPAYNTVADDADMPPPPPPYHVHTDNVFLRPEFLLTSDRQSGSPSVRYEENPDLTPESPVDNRNSLQPLLPPSPGF